MTNDKRLLDSSELATYMVCPEAWRLKLQGEKNFHASKRAQDAKEKRREWVKNQEISSQFKYYAKILYTLLLMIVITLFIIDLKTPEHSKDSEKSSSIMKEHRE